MPVLTCPVIPIPNPTVLSELSMALVLRAAEIKQLIGSETDPTYEPKLRERAKALDFLLSQVDRVKAQVAPTIDIIAEEVPNQGA